MMNVVYIMCPVKWVTGGTEALHQLAHVINGLGGNAKMVYYDHLNYAVGNNPPLPFRIYNTKASNTIEDKKGNSIVFPESKLTWINDFKNLKKYVWWLSVDNADSYDDGFFQRDDVVHLYQSAYARDLLLNNQVKYLKPLSDYINLPYFQTKKNRSGVAINFTKTDLAYQPLIIAIKTKFEIKEIKNMSKWDVLKVFSKVKVYIDFGGFPGKDRMPREAVLLGARLVLSDKGSAGNTEDFPFLQEYKVDLLEQNDIISMIQDLFSSEINSKHNQVFNQYKNHLQSEFEQFVMEVSHIFELDRQKIAPAKSNLRRILFLDHVLYSCGMYYNSELRAKNKCMLIFKKMVRKVLLKILKV